MEWGVEFAYAGALPEQLETDDSSMAAEDRPLPPPCPVLCGKGEVRP